MNTPKMCTAIVQKREGILNRARFCGDESTRTYRLANGLVHRCAKHRKLHIEES